MVTYFQVTEISENPGNQCKFGGIKSVTGQKQTGISKKKTISQSIHTPHSIHPTAMNILIVF